MRLLPFLVKAALLLFFMVNFYSWWLFLVAVGGLFFVLWLVVS